MKNLIVGENTLTTADTMNSDTENRSTGRRPMRSLTAPNRI